MESEGINVLKLNTGNPGRFGVKLPNSVRQALEIVNAVNRDRLLDAQKHPENYRNLIVRVWGWSGYFVELNEVYQNHIIKRSEMSL